MDLEIGQLDLRYAPLRVLDPGRVSRLAASLSAEGQKAPVLVVGDGVLVDGYHRVSALRLLGRDGVEALSLDVPEAEALVLAWRIETGRRKTALEEGWLLAELVGHHGRTAAALARELHRSKSWVSQRLGLVSVLPDAVADAVRAAKVPAQGAMKALLPMARQDPGAAETLVGALSGPVTVRELDRIYGAWRKADGPGRARILAHPDLFLKADDAVRPVPADAEERLARDFEGLVGMCSRARKAVAEGVFARANSALLRGTWASAREAFRALEVEVERARCADTRRDPAASS